ncbi:BON domain-containing protein [Gimesia sp.]|uniref:BON domain-containing protein n=1 Tax=Gimesia sp. TaxID=2024833 RepID=UPI003A913D58
MLRKSQRGGAETRAKKQLSDNRVSLIPGCGFESGSQVKSEPDCSAELVQSSELIESVVHALATRNCRSLREVTIALEGSCVSLHGTVRTYYAKQLAQQTVISVPGVTKIFNALVVE